jgi:uracil-DNA glycosylase family 4
MISGGFFEVEEARVPIPLLPSCGQCGLFHRCKSPKMEPFGKGKKKILLAGEAPGKNEDFQGRPFVGEAGRLLREVLDKIGIDMDRDCLTTNALICRPSKTNEIKNPKSIDFCRPNLVRTIKDFNPDVIIPLGSVAVRSLITGWLWPDSGGSGSKEGEDKNLRGKWCGWRIPCQQLNAWITPTWHPSFVARMENSTSSRDRERSKLVKMLFKQDLKATADLDGKPWKKVPDWPSKVVVELDDSRAAESAQRMLDGRDGRPMAFDIETESLKPQEKTNSIYTCSISDGRTALAFPWHGKVIQWMKDFARSNVPKIGFNCKFETCWFLEKLGVRVNNWVWDGMLAAHLLDNRPNTTDLSFQAFVRLGMPHWDKRVSPYLKAKGGSNAKNRIKELDLKHVLYYNGLDSILEWRVANHQMKEMGVSIHERNLEGHQRV